MDKGQTRRHDLSEQRGLTVQTAFNCDILTHVHKVTLTVFHPHHPHSKRSMASPTSRVTYPSVLSINYWDKHHLEGEQVRFMF